jgi:hypothetical protein
MGATVIESAATEVMSAHGGAAHMVSTHVAAVAAHVAHMAAAEAAHVVAAKATHMAAAEVTAAHVAAAKTAVAAATVPATAVRPGVSWKTEREDGQTGGANPVQSS